MSASTFKPTEDQAAAIRVLDSGANVFLTGVVGEVWRSVVGFEKLYVVSSHGRVAALHGAHGEPAFHILKPGTITSRGTLNCVLTKNGARFNRRMHRLVLDAFVGPCPAGFMGLHKNDIGSDNRCENLYWGTHADNMRDRAVNRRTARGVRTASSKLTDERVRALREEHAAGVSAGQLAKRVKLSKSAVCRLINRQTWGHVS